MKTTKTKKSSVLTNGVAKQIADYKAKKAKFEALIERLTVDKTAEAHLLKFIPKDHHLITVIDANNRATTKPYIKHQLNLLRSVDECGMLSAVAVVIRDNQIQVAEGANRVTAWKTNGNTFYAFISKGSFSDTFTNANMYVKPLRNSELIDHCTKDGEFTKDYLTLALSLREHKQIAKKSGRLNQIQPCLISALLAGEDRVLTKKLIQSKKFKTSEALIKQTNRITKQVYDLQKVGLPSGIRVNEGIIKLILEKGENYKHEKFTYLIKKANIDSIVSSNNAKAITNKLRDLHDNTVNGIPKRK